MFYINDEKVNYALKEQPNLVARQIVEKMEELRPQLIKKPMRLNWKKGVMSINSLQKLKEGKRGVYPSYATIINNEQGTNKVVYCTQAIKDAVGNVKYSPKGDWFNGSQVLRIEDIELAVYYSLFCPYVKSGLIVIENLEADAAEVAAVRSKMAKYSYYLYNETSELYDDKEKLIEIAKAFGVPNADGMTLEMLKNQIYDAVTIRETAFGDGIKFFENLLQGSDPMAKPLADVQSLVDSKEIFLDQNDFGWKWKGGNKMLALNPTDVQNVTAAKKRLANHLLANEEVYETVNAILAGKVKDVANVETLEDLEHLSRKDLLIFAQSNGMKGAQKMSNEKIIIELQQKLGL